MSITAKQIAKELGISATAVSMALNNKPGVSTQRRREILQYATKRGFDFSRLHGMQEQGGIIQVIFYKTNNAILSYSPIFNEILDGIKDALLRTNYRVYTTQFYEKTDSIEACLADLRLSSCKGILLLGTEIHREVCQKFLSLRLPLILLDSYFDSLNCTSVSINNCQGAYLATDFLISMQASQPGHLQSSYGIPNFRQRREGYEKAIRENGMSVSRSIRHSLSPSMEGAMADMLEVIDSGLPLASCYFADNDSIAIGAIKALKLRGLRIPEDIAIVGFDNISESRIIDPSLTTIDVPRLQLGKVAARLLLDQIHSHSTVSLKVELATHLVKRLSHCRP